VALLLPCLQVILTATWHMSNSYMWMVLPVILYFADVGLRWTLHGSTATAMAVVVPLGDSVMLSDTQEQAMEQGGAVAAPIKAASSKGSKVVASSMVKLSIPIAELLAVNPGFDLEGEYLMVQVPQLGVLEWHPLSVAYMDATHVHLLVKTAGTWTAKLAGLGLAGTSTSQAAALGAAQVQVKVGIEGPYGNPITNNVLDQLSQGASVLLVAGGVGVASMVRTLQAAAAGAGGKRALDWSRLHLLWVVRSGKVRGSGTAVSGACRQSASVWFVFQQSAAACHAVKPRPLCKSAGATLIPSNAPAFV
jgi:hypothetical protein